MGKFAAEKTFFGKQIIVVSLFYCSIVVLSIKTALYGAKHWEKCFARRFYEYSS